MFSGAVVLRKRRGKLQDGGNESCNLVKGAHRRHEAERNEQQERQVLRR
jgi:hypothetical protein